MSNFAFAFRVLPRERREGLDAVYAYCRLMDDIVDGDLPELRTLEQRQAELTRWRAVLDWAFAEDLPAAAPPHPTAAALREAHLRFALVKEDALAVLEGCQMDLEMDLRKSRYGTWEDLRGYCYRVASAVGLLCIGVFGVPEARDYAVELGLALQLTNIVRDVAEDGERGRVYLPLADLAAFGVSEAELLSGQPRAALDRLFAFEAQRAREHYLRAHRALHRLDKAQRRRLLAAELMGGVYRGLLGEIERSRFALYPPARRIALPRRRKLAVALRTFGRSLLDVV